MYHHLLICSPLSGVPSSWLFSFSQTPARATSGVSAFSCLFRFLQPRRFHLPLCLFRFGFWDIAIESRPCRFELTWLFPMIKVMIRLVEIQLQWCDLLSAFTREHVMWLLLVTVCLITWLRWLSARFLHWKGIFCAHYIFPPSASSLFGRWCQDILVEERGSEMGKKRQVTKGAKSGQFHLGRKPNLIPLGTSGANVELTAQPYHTEGRRTPGS